MRKVPLSGNFGVTLAICAGMTLLFATPAKAPANSLATRSPERSIAAIQEAQDFDPKLERYRYCYGVHVNYDRATPERRRECKARILLRLNQALSTPGSYFSIPLHFECQNTAEGFTKWYNWKNVPVLKLKPNRELEVIEQAINNYLVREDDVTSWMRAREACEVYLDCRDQLSVSKLINFEVLERCFLNANYVTRDLLVQDVVGYFFRRETDGMLIARLLQRQRSLARAKKHSKTIGITDIPARSGLK